MSGTSGLRVEEEEGAVALVVPVSVTAAAEGELLE
jgi:hypothetical protein